MFVVDVQFESPNSLIPLLSFWPPSQRCFSITSGRQRVKDTTTCMIIIWHLHIAHPTLAASEFGMLAVRYSHVWTLPFLPRHLGCRDLRQQWIQTQPTILQLLIYDVFRRHQHGCKGPNRKAGNVLPLTEDRARPMEWVTDKKYWWIFSSQFILCTFPLCAFACFAIV
jgi:hypothetical protein